MTLYLNLKHENKSYKNQKLIQIEDQVKSLKIIKSLEQKIKLIKILINIVSHCIILYCCDLL